MAIKHRFNAVIVLPQHELPLATGKPMAVRSRPVGASPRPSGGFTSNVLFFGGKVPLARIKAIAATAKKH
jgi:hypothetical protein